MKTTKNNEERAYKSPLQILAESKSNVKRIFDWIDYEYKAYTESAFRIIDNFKNG